MSGHSKWANIKHRKARQDAEKGKVFTKVSKDIIVAVREGGPDPEANFKLRLALQKARSANMPGGNIERVIARASGGEEDSHYEEIAYEGYGPGGVALYIDITTDNRNRTASDVRHILAKHGGNLGEGGCVAWMFEQKGRIVVDLDESGITEDELMETVLDSGAIDMEVDGGLAVVYSAPSDLEMVQKAVEASGASVSEASVTRVPESFVRVEAENIAVRVLDLIDELEDCDDVSAVYANYDIPDSLIEKIRG